MSVMTFCELETPLIPLTMSNCIIIVFRNQYLHDDSRYCFQINKYAVIEICQNLLISEYGL